MNWVTKQCGNGDRIGRALWPLESHAIYSQVCGPIGFESSDDPEIESRLEVLLKSIEAEANLTPVGRFLTWMHIRDLLKTRRALENYWKTAEDGNNDIKRPVFITGIPRSGSTFLHELM